MKQDEITVTANGGLNRRDFLKLGTGLAVYFWTGPVDLFGQAPPAVPTDFNAYIHIGADGRVICMVGKIEMGQGLQTALAQNLAEELDVAFDSVDMIMGDTDLCPWDVGTFGSMANRMLGPILRGAAAEARAVLLQMASERLHAPVERLRAKDGVVTDTASGKHVSYAELVQGKRIERKLGKIPLKPTTDYKVMGTSVPRKDAIEKVTGQAKYTADFVVPGMVFARVLRPPAHGAALKSIDTSAAEKVPGAQVVKDGNLIAVIANRPDIADKALGLIKAQFEPSQNRLDDKSIFDHLVAAKVENKLMVEKGNLAEGEKAGELFERTYYHSYGAHAHMETHSSLVKIEGGKATVWASTQRPFGVRDSVAQALGFTPQNVRVITPYVGGGFGGKNYVQNAVETARLAKLVDKPVQLVWDRSEDFMYDRFRPAGVVKIRSAITKEGQVSLWDFTVYAAGDWGAPTFYDVPNQRTVAAPIAELAWRRGDNAGGVHPFNVGAWRMPGTNTISFARESQMDIMASKAGIDPVEFRLKHLSDKRMRGVLEAAAKQFGWKPGKAPSGRGVGVACGLIYVSYVASMAEVEVDKNTGEVRVRRVVTAVDPGTIVNPEGARQQIESCITMGLGYALSEEVRFKNGEVLARNFDSYEIPRFSDMPKMEVVLAGTPGLPPDGLGEPPIITMGSVIANAIYDATGARLFQLPMTPERVKVALKQS
ncbi:MAG: molybdopterin cofactor-binding domain-containing protein [Candidatus Korobacteraceae bacterium]|jgi:isoquinoline 1-oxidoreductase